MINELEIQGYKGLKNVSMKGLRRLTLLGGRNNVGKTSVLEAFFMSRDWGNAELLTRHLKWRGVEAFETSADSAWSPSFTNFNLRNDKIQIRTRDPQGDRTTFTVQTIEAPTRISTSSATASGTDTSVAQNIRAPGEPSLRLLFQEGSRAVFEASVTISGGIPPYVLTPTKRERKAEPVHFVLARQRTSATEDAMNFGKLDAAKRTDEVVSLLRAIEPKLSGLSIIPVGPQPLIYADVEGLPKKIPVNLLGDGLTRLLSMLLHLASVEDGYLLIDEVENAFHHSAMPSVWRALYTMSKKQKSQIIATTHSYECLVAFSSSLKDIAGEEFSYVRLDRGDAEIEATTYDAKALESATESGWEVR